MNDQADVLVENDMSIESLAKAMEQHEEGGDPDEEAQPDTAAAEEQPLEDSEAPEEGEGDEPKPESVEPAADEVVLPDGTKVSKDEVVKGYLRQSDYTRKQQDLAEMRQKAEQEIAQYRDVQLQKIQEYEKHITESDPIGRIDAAIKDAAEIGDIDEVNRLEIQRIKTIAHLQAVKADRDALMEKKRQDEAGRIREYLDRGREELSARIPELKDPSKREATKSAIAGAFREVGFSDTEIANLGDPRAAQIAYYAAKYLESTKVTPEAAQKLKGKAVTPSTAARQSTSRSDAALRNLSENPSVDSLAKTFKELGI